MLIPSTPIELAAGFMYAPTHGLVTTALLTAAAKLSANIVSVLVARKLLAGFVKRRVMGLANGGPASAAPPFQFDGV